MNSINNENGSTLERKEITEMIKNLMQYEKQQESNKLKASNIN